MYAANRNIWDLLVVGCCIIDSSYTLSGGLDLPDFTPGSHRVIALSLQFCLPLPRRLFPINVLFHVLSHPSPPTSPAPAPLPLPRLSRSGRKFICRKFIRRISLVAALTARENDQGLQVLVPFSTSKLALASSALDDTRAPQRPIIIGRSSTAGWHC